EPIEARILSKAIENAQKRVESDHFAVRRNVLKFDDVINKQREVIYGERRKVLDNENLKDSVFNMADKTFGRIIAAYAGDKFPDYWQWDELNANISKIMTLEAPIAYEKKELERLNSDFLKEDIMKIFAQNYEKQEEVFGDNMREAERVIMLQVVDRHWMQHIDDMDQLREGIGLRSYAQHDPIVEYQTVGYDMFEELISTIQDETVKYLLHVRPTAKATERKQIATVTNEGESKEKPVVRAEKKVGRNDLCPCGSGKKYKQCCGHNE
ncbi:MAG: SEC-C metal-binding domain-containing protein, partial [Bacillota bacterium]|nr:SEC-C metal-binding domain-containing protein [Bacillota bacterium]